MTRLTTTDRTDSRLAAALERCAWLVLLAVLNAVLVLAALYAIARMGPPTGPLSVGLLGAAVGVPTALTAEAYRRLGV